jgi:hypothetical protein
MQKYGFIYIWFDRKRKMYYIGCHWGTEDDGYICSSKRMRDAYRRRPEDFKRRILKRKIEREELLKEEFKWLELIPKEKLGKKYYNHRIHHHGHWSNDLNSNITIGEKIRQKLIGRSSKKKGTTISEETREKIRQKLIGRSSKKKGTTISEETREKIRSARAKQVITEETKQKIREFAKNNPYNHSEEMKNKISNSLSGRKLSHSHIEKMKNSKINKKIGKLFKWTIENPNGIIYTEHGLNVFCRENGICANNLRTRGHSKGFKLLAKTKIG